MKVTLKEGQLTLTAENDEDKAQLNHFHLDQDGIYFMKIHKEKDAIVFQPQNGRVHIISNGELP